MPGPPSAARRRIFLADCDAMFVSVARLEDPEGAGKAELLIVGGSPEGRGVVTSASYACREYGVRSAMPMRRALELCPDAVVTGVPREAVARISERIRTILSEIAVVLEAASVDEFYLDLSGTEKALGEDPVAIARDIRERVLDDTGISLSIGCATNKLVAKLAATVAKPGGVHAVPPGEEATFMRRFDLSDIPGVGPKGRERLARHGLRSVTDVVRYPLDGLVRLLGEREGRWLHRKVRGEDDRPVELRGPGKSHSRENTFPRDLEIDREIERELLALVVRCAGDVRRTGRLARTITVKVRDGDFRTRQASRTLDQPLGSDRRAFEEACLLLGRLRATRRVGVRLLGVTLSGFVDKARVREGDQLGLFPGELEQEAEGERDRDLTRAIDALRSRFGTGAIVPGRLLDGNERSRA